MKLNADILEGFTSTFLLGRYDETTGQVPAFHREMWEYCCDDCHQVALAVPRAHAKSTAITFAFALASLLFRVKRHIIILSSTEDMASDFVGDIRTELLENEKLAEYFQFQRFLKESESELIGRFKDGTKFRVIAKGAGQKMRGIKWDRSRPDLAIVDDIEDDEIVMNQDRRIKFKRWFYGAVRPILSLRGDIRIVGTILHLDSMLENVMPKPASDNTVTDGLKIYSKELIRGEWLSVKYRAHNEDYSQILWPERFPRERLENIREEYTARGLPDLYNQEFLNDPIDESTAFFKAEWFKESPSEENWAKRSKKYYIACDLAVSTGDQANYTAFVVAALDDLGRLEITYAEKGRWDSLEIIEHIFELYNKYRPEMFGIEKGQIELALGPFLNSEMHRRRIYVPIQAIAARKDKITRAKAIQGRMRLGDVYFRKANGWYSEFFEELKKFPRSRTDDYVDAFAHIGALLELMITPPTEEEIKEEEYWEDRRLTGTFGANRWTGY